MCWYVPVVKRLPHPLGYIFQRWFQGRRITHCGWRAEPVAKVFIRQVIVFGGYMHSVTLAPGCNELIFNPLIQWWRKGPISKQLRIFVWSGAPCTIRLVWWHVRAELFVESPRSDISCRHVLILCVSLRSPILCSSEAFLDGIAAAAILTLLNYLILGFQIQIDGFFLHSFEIWLACTVVFPGLGNLGYTLLEYRLGQRSLLSSLFENLTWIPFL